MKEQCKKCKHIVAFVPRGKPEVEPLYLCMFEPVFVDEGKAWVDVGGFFYDDCSLFEKYEGENE